MPAERQFETVALRAVDDMPEAIAKATSRSSRYLAILATPAPEVIGATIPHFALSQTLAIPESTNRVLQIYSRLE